MGTRADVDAEVYAPEQCTVELIAVEQGGARVAVMGIIVSIGRVPFQDDLILPVTINITYRGVVG